MKANYQKLLETLKQKGVNLNSLHEYMKPRFETPTPLPPNKPKSNTEEVSQTLVSIAPKTDTEEVSQTLVSITPKTDSLEVSKTIVASSPKKEVLTPSTPLQQIALKLLTDNRLDLPQLNQVLESLHDIEDSQEFLQSLFKSRHIQLEEFLDLKKMEAGTTQIIKSSPYQIRTSEKGKLEFFLSPPEENKKVYGHYHVLEELARGGMGIVYKAYHPGLNQSYALKVMKSGKEVSSEALKRFEREIKSTAKLKHPNIVQVIDSGVKQNTSKKKNSPKPNIIL